MTYYQTVPIIEHKNHVTYSEVYNFIPHTHKVYIWRIPIVYQHVFLQGDLFVVDPYTEGNLYLGDISTGL